MTFSLAFVAGVTPTKWTRLWAERRPDVPLDVFRVEPVDQSAVLRDGRADVSLVRLPIDEHDEHDQQELSVIPLYTEIPVVVAAKGHAIEGVENVAVTDLADEHLLQNPDEVPGWRDVATELRDGTRRPLPAMRDMEETMEQVAAGVGILIVPHSIARLYGRKDVISRPIEGVEVTQIALVWPSAKTTKEVEEFVGIVRGRTSSSSRAATVVVRGEPEKKEKKTAKAKAAAKLAREASAKANPASPRRTQGGGPGRTRNTPNPRNKRRGSR